MSPLFLLFVLFILVIFLIIKTVGHIPSLRTVKLLNRLPGPTDLPFFIGAALQVSKLNVVDLIPWIEDRFNKHGSTYATYFMGAPGVFTRDPDVFEAILTSTKNIEKGPDYDVLKDWLNGGLLLSTGEKWKQRRRILTPSFHFKILGDNMECMNRNWKKVVQTILESKGAPVEPMPIMGRGALNIICESAMGTSLDTEVGSAEYVQASKRVAENSIKRALSPLLRNDILFKMSPLGRTYRKDLAIVHGFTEKVVKAKKKAFEAKQLIEESEYVESEDKTSRVFLESLLELSQNESLTEADIRAEVDTFMFAGYDTTTTGLNFMLLHLAENPDIQEKAYREQLDIFGYSDREVVKEDLSKMHYLEQVIKESMRLHPPAPQIMRLLVEDAKIKNGMIIPAGAMVGLNIFLAHRNPEYFPDPEVFDPDRFSVEQSKNRHPYCYIPFSAGPRNCIGQKFAMMEMKIALSTILRMCKIAAVTRQKDLKYRMTVTLNPTIPVRMRITPRN